MQLLTKQMFSSHRYFGYPV